MSWQLYTAISVLGLSVSVILQRVLIHKDKLDPVAYTVFFQALVACIITVFVQIDGFTLANIGNYWLPAVASMFLFGAGHIVYAKTLQRVEASVFAIYFATHAIWVMLLGILLFGERLTLLQALGSLLIFVSVSLVVKSFRHFRPDTGVLLGILTGVMFGLAITSWAYVGRHTDALSWAAASFAGASLAALLFSPKAMYKFRPMLSPKVLPRMLLLGVFYAIGSVAMLYAYRSGTLSVVSPLRQTSIIVTTVLALALLSSERVKIRRKVLASVICMAGVLLLVI
jgi:drug/metabolite transporter (DMT)-like permease